MFLVPPWHLTAKSRTNMPITCTHFLLCRPGAIRRNHIDKLFKPCMPLAYHSFFLLASRRIIRWLPSAGRNLKGSINRMMLNQTPNKGPKPCSTLGSACLDISLSGIGHPNPTQRYRMGTEAGSSNKVPNNHTPLYTLVGISPGLREGGARKQNLLEAQILNAKGNI